jgi:hypothetical protein
MEENRRTVGPEPPSPDTVYHYTDIESLKGIVV